MALSGTDNMTKLAELGQRTYKEQACFFLNAFWKSLGENSSEDVWKYCNSMVSLDEKKGAFGSELDELSAHKFLEKSEETMTVRELREVLRSIDIDTNKMVSMSEYLIFKFKIDWAELVNSIQGNPEEVEKAQSLLSAAQSRLAESQECESEAKKSELAARGALKVASDAEDAAKASEQLSLEAKAAAEKAEEEVRAAEARVKAATDEVVAAKLKVDAAVKELHAQEKAYADRLSSLDARGSDASLGLVARNKAKNELAQAKTEDPLPLQRAKITAEAEQRKHEKLSKAAFEERENAAIAVTAAKEATVIATKAAELASLQARSAETKRAEAEAAKQVAETARHAAEAALAEAERAFEEARAFLEKAKNTIPKGTLWWMERELEEAKFYMPQAKGGKTRN